MGSSSRFRLASGPIVLAALAAVSPGGAQESGWTLVEAESFDSGSTQRCDLEPTWSVRDGLLRGRGRGWARCSAVRGTDLRIRLRLRLAEEGSRLHLSYRVSEAGRYFVGFHARGLHLSKEAPWGTFRHELASSRRPHQTKAWHWLDLAAEGPRLEVSVDGERELEFLDPEPLRGGILAFETLEGAVVEIDDLTVLGRGPPPTLPDLAILTAGRWRVEDQRALVVSAEVLNQGAGEAVPTRLLAETADRRSTSMAPVPGLAPGGRAVVDVWIDLPVGSEGAYSLRLQIDPEGEIEEADEGNNVALMQVVLPPPADPRTGPRQPSVPPPSGAGEALGFGEILLASLALGALALGVRWSLRTGRRRRAESEAREGEPSERCQPGARYCRVTKVRIAPARDRITRLLVAYGNVSGVWRRERHVGGRLAADLDRAVRRRAGGLADREDLARVARQIAERIATWLSREGGPTELLLAVLWQGGGMTTEFTLYRCRGCDTRGVWEIEDRWKVKTRDRVREPVGTLRDLHPGAAAFRELLISGLTRLVEDLADHPGESRATTDEPQGCAPRTSPTDDSTINSRASQPSPRAPSGARAE